MLTFEQFEKILKDIQKNQEENKKLTEILVCKDSGGWISTCEYLVDDLLSLLKTIFNDENDDISWWLWDGNKNIYWKDYKYDLTEIKDLYYWLSKDYEKVKKEKEN